MRKMRKFSAAAAGTVHRSSRAGILQTSRDIWRPHTRRFLNESKVSSFIIIPFKSARPVHIELMYFLLLATKKALREKIVASQRIETRNPLADLLSLGEAEAAGERSADTVPVVQEEDSGTAQSGTAAGAEGAGNSSSRKRKVSFIIHCLPQVKRSRVPSFIKSKVVYPSFHTKVLNP